MGVCYVKKNEMSICYVLTAYCNQIKKQTNKQNTKPLLDKVMSRNQGHIGVQEHHLMLKDPYVVIKRRCVWDKTFPLGQFCCDMGQNDTIGKIELNPSFVLSSDNTNCKNDIQ